MPTLQDPDILYICFCRQLINVLFTFYFVNFLLACILQICILQIFHLM